MIKIKKNMIDINKKKYDKNEEKIYYKYRKI